MGRGAKTIVAKLRFCFLTGRPKHNCHGIELSGPERPNILVAKLP